MLLCYFSSVYDAYIAHARDVKQVCPSVSVCPHILEEEI